MEQKAKRPTLHPDHTVTYWSMTFRMWMHREDRIPQHELDAMPKRTRDRVIAHLSQGKPDSYVEELLAELDRLDSFLQMVSLQTINL